MAVRDTGLTFDVRITDLRIIRNARGYVKLADEETRLEHSERIGRDVLYVMNRMNPKKPEKAMPQFPGQAVYDYIRGEGMVKYYYRKRVKEGQQPISEYHRYDSQRMTGNFTFDSERISGAGRQDYELVWSNTATYTPWVVVSEFQTFLHNETGWGTLEDIVADKIDEWEKIKDNLIQTWIDDPNNSLGKGELVELEKVAK